MILHKSRGLEQKQFTNRKVKRNLNEGLEFCMMIKLVQECNINKTETRNKVMFQIMARKSIRILISTAYNLLIIMLVWR